MATYQPWAKDKSEVAKAKEVLDHLAKAEELLRTMNEPFWAREIQNIGARLVHENDGSAA